MKPFGLGNDTLLVVNRVPQLDGNGDPVVDDYNHPVMADSTVTVPGCAIRELSSSERNSNVNPTDTEVRALLPITFIGVDTGNLGQTVTLSLTKDSAITWPLKPAPNVYEVQGDPRLATDLDGDLDHWAVTARCRRG